MFSITYRHPKARFHSISFQTFGSSDLPSSNEGAFWAQFHGRAEAATLPLFVSAAEALRSRNNCKRRNHRHHHAEPSRTPGSKPTAPLSSFATKPGGRWHTRRQRRTALPSLYIQVVPYVTVDAFRRGDLS
jgi:hypothetical protein